METSVIENLDLACATVNKSIVEHPSQELKKLITDALSVLEEQGVYALFLYLNSQYKGKREKTKNIESIWNGLETLLKSTPSKHSLLSSQAGGSSHTKPGQESGEKFLASIREELAPDTEKLLLAQSLLSQTLVYARYHAQPDEKEKSS